MRVAFMDAMTSATAFIMRCSPTISGMIAWRGGIISATARPCTSPPMNRCSKRSTSNASKTPMASTPTRSITCPACSTWRFGSRSASTPQSGEKTSAGIAVASEIAPSAANEPVNQNARKVRASKLRCMPRPWPIIEMKYQR